MHQGAACILGRRQTTKHVAERPVLNNRLTKLSLNVDRSGGWEKFMCMRSDEVSVRRYSEGPSGHAVDVSVGCRTVQSRPASFL